MLIEFVNWLINSNEGNVVVLVPTCALITQVIQDLEDVVKNEKYKILQSPEILKLWQHKNLIFVFTPERLISYFSNTGNPVISSLIIDEAQNIVENAGRTTTFYHAITLAQDHQTKFYFASPSVPNPELFLDLFELADNPAKRITEVNVVQRLFFIDMIENKATLYLDFLEDEPKYEIEY